MKEENTTHTHPGPLPDEGNSWLLTEEERGAAGGEVGVLEENPLAQTLLLQLLVGLPRALGGPGSPRQRWQPRLRVLVQVGHGSLPPARDRSQERGGQQKGREQEDKGEGAKIPLLPCKGKGGGKEQERAVGKAMVSSSPPPLHLLELQGETDLPAALNSGGDEHPESKQGRRAAGPVNAGSGSGQVVPCPPPGQSHLAGRACTGPGTAPQQGWASRWLPPCWR